MNSLHHFWPYSAPFRTCFHIHSIKTDLCCHNVSIHTYIYRLYKKRKHASSTKKKWWRKEYTKKKNRWSTYSNREAFWLAQPKAWGGEYTYIHNSWVCVHITIQYSFFEKIHTYVYISLSFLLCCSPYLLVQLLYTRI